MTAPIKYQPSEVWKLILEKIATGSSLSAICREPGAPSYSWCKLALRSNSELRASYDEAVADRADVLAEEVERIADEEIPENLDGQGASAWIQRQRLRVDARKWSACKLAPRRYGDKISVEAPLVNIDFRGLIAERDRQLAEYCAKNPVVIDHATITEES
jgi:hypothetical protein